MAKWCGNIGFAVTEEVKPGIWKENLVVRKYFGDVIRNSRRLQQSDSVIDNVIISNSISIVADPYAKENFHAIRYAEFMGTKWKISNIEVQYPRLILTLGDLYNA